MLVNDRPLPPPATVCPSVNNIHDTTLRAMTTQASSCQEVRMRLPSNNIMNVEVPAGMTFCSNEY